MPRKHAGIRPREGRPLTPREQQVWDLREQGYSYLNIASLLEISEETVKQHMTHVLEKKGGASTVDVLSWLNRSHGARKRNLRIKIAQLTHQLAALQDELAILEEETHEKNVSLIDLAPHPGGLDRAHADVHAHSDMVQSRPV